MKYYIVLFSFALFSSCSPFNQLSKNTEIGHDELHRTVYNTEAKLMTKTFGDVRIATDKKQFKALNNGQPDFKDILFYAKTEAPEYEYYVLINSELPEYNSDLYELKDIAIAENKFIVLISKSSPEADKQFILNNLSHLD